MSMATLYLWAGPEWTSSYEKAQTQALNTQKNIMIMLSKEPCDACWYMENIVFDNAKVKALIKADFIPVYMNVDLHKVPERFTYVGTPTIYFTNADGRIIGEKLEGAFNAKDFIQKLNKISKEAKP